MNVVIHKLFYSSNHLFETLDMEIFRIKLVHLYLLFPIVSIYSPIFKLILNKFSKMFHVFNIFSWDFETSRINIRLKRTRVYYSMEINIISLSFNYVLVGNNKSDSNTLKQSLIEVPCIIISFAWLTHKKTSY